jgi:3-oxoacyl-ACP reductase-like protein
MDTEKDFAFWEGFEAAIELVSTVFSNYKEEIYDDIWNDIEDEISLYRKDG